MFLFDLPHETGSWGCDVQGLGWKDRYFFSQSIKQRTIHDCGLIVIACNCLIGIATNLAAFALPFALPSLPFYNRILNVQRVW